MAKPLLPPVRGRRALWLGLTLACGILAVSLAAPAPGQAQTKCGLTFIYYDSSYTKVVGVRSYAPTSCGCYLSSWGTISAQREIEDSSC